MERSSGCGFSTVGSGLPACIDLGSGGSSGTVGSGGAGVFCVAVDEGAGTDVEDGVGEDSEGVTARFLALCSIRAAALGGNFRFLSIVLVGKNTDDKLNR